MTEAEHVWRSESRRALAGALLCTAMMLTGCASLPAQHPQLLQPEDLPPVETIDDRKGTGLTWTNCAGMSREDNLAITAERERHLSYLLEGGGEVRSAIQGPYVNVESIDYTFDELRSMVDECAQTDRDSFEELTGLPEGAIGFRTELQTSNGVETTERAYAPTGENTAVVVTVLFQGDKEPTIGVAELLPKALDRAVGE